MTPEELLDTWFENAKSLGRSPVRTSPTRMITRLGDVECEHGIWEILDSTDLQSSVFVHGPDPESEARIRIPMPVIPPEGLVSGWDVLEQDAAIDRWIASVHAYEAKLMEAAS